MCFGRFIFLNSVFSFKYLFSVNNRETLQSAIIVLLLRTCRKHGKADSHISKMQQDRNKSSSIITAFTHFQQHHNRNYFLEAVAEIAIQWSHSVSYDNSAPWKLLLISGFASPSRVHTSFCHSLQTVNFIHLLILKRKPITVYTRVIYA